ncbi:MAG: nucleotide exchange factor GrpE [Pseudomonadota bacterium]
MSASDQSNNDVQTDEEIADQIARELAGEDTTVGDDAAAASDEIAELNDRILRLTAELENTRRRAEREKVDAGRYAIANFARDLISVADNFERALAAAPSVDDAPSAEAVAGLVTGLRMTDNELMAALQRHGVKKIDPKGEKFDPNMHQAVAQAPSDEAPAGHVAEVAQTGFMIGDRILRAAMVVVSTGPTAPAEPGATVDTQA